jgi:ribosomal protein S21
LDDIQIWKIIGNVRKIKKNFYHNLGDRVWKQYNELSIVWGEENAEKRKKKLKKEKKNNTQIVQLIWEIKNKKIPFTKVVTKQKKSFKISWKTFPSVKVVISWMQDDIVLYSDDSWKYETKIHTWLQPGEYNLSFFVEDDTWELFAINRDKKIILEEEYLQNMRRYYIPKAVSKKWKQKIIESKKDNSILESSLENQNSENTSERNIRILVANIFTTLIVFFLIFLILRKEKII